MNESDQLKTPKVQLWKKGVFERELPLELAQQFVDFGMYKVRDEQSIEWVSPYSRNGGHDGARI